MSASIPESHVALLEGPVYAILTTLSPSGKPENTVVWCDWDGTYVRVNTRVLQNSIYGQVDRSHQCEQMASQVMFRLDEARSSRNGLKWA